MGNVAKGILKGAGVSALTGLPIPFLKSKKKKKKGAAPVPVAPQPENQIPENAGVISQMVNPATPAGLGEAMGAVAPAMEEGEVETPRQRAARQAAQRAARAGAGAVPPVAAPTPPMAMGAPGIAAPVTGGRPYGGAGLGGATVNNPLLQDQQRRKISMF